MDGFREAAPSSSEPEAERDTPRPASAAEDARSRPGEGASCARSGASAQVAALQAIPEAAVRQIDQTMTIDLEAPKTPPNPCRITWCGDPSDGKDGWCWKHMVLGHLDGLSLATEDAARVRKALLENWIP